MSWADRAKLCMEWAEGDEERLVRLREWMAPEEDAFVDGLVEYVTELEGVPRLLVNGRFTGRLHALLQEWVSGLLAPAYCDVEHQERRRDLGRRLARLNINYEHVILLDGIASRSLLTVVTENLEDCADQLSPTLDVLHKALAYDRGLIHAGFVELRDSEMEQALLDRFLAITGFSPSLYEGLAETWEQDQAQGTMSQG